MNSHYREHCLYCGTVISQCRCPSENKTESWGLCEHCFSEDKDSSTLQKNELVRSLLNQIELARRHVSQIQLDYNLLEKRAKRLIEDNRRLISERDDAVKIVEKIEQFIAEIRR